MAASKPILTMINGVGNDIVHEAECGLTASAGDYKMLAANVKKMYAMSKETRERMGQNALNYYAKHFDKDKVVDEIITAIQN